MPSLLSSIGARSRELMASVPVGGGYVAGAERNGSLVGLIDIGRVMRDIGLGVLCGVGLGVFAAMIGDLC
jgi:hypothetical protein